MFGALLREWRTRAGKSQLRLSVDARVSARHISFLESGRANASPEMVFRLCEALGLGLRDRNAMLVAAGFAPRFGENRWESEAFRDVRRAARLILETHEPYPALVLDAATTILDANEGALAMIGESRRIVGETCLMDLVFQPGPVRDAIDNWAEIATFLIARHRETARLHGPRSKAAEVLARALVQPGVAELGPPRPSAPGQVLVPLTFTRDGTTTRWFTTLTSFGAPQDALLEEVTIEQFHPM